MPRVRRQEPYSDAGRPGDARLPPNLHAERHLRNDRRSLRDQAVVTFCPISMGFLCVACDSGECLEHGSKFHRMASMETLTVAGMPLVRTHTCKECDTWELFDKAANEGGQSLGEVSLYHTPSFPYPSINSINFEKARGRGL